MNENGIYYCIIITRICVIRQRCFVKHFTRFGALYSEFITKRYYSDRRQGLVKEKKTVIVQLIDISTSTRFNATVDNIIPILKIFDLWLTFYHTHKKKKTVFKWKSARNRKIRHNSKNSTRPEMILMYIIQKFVINSVWYRICTYRIRVSKYIALQVTTADRRILTVAVTQSRRCPARRCSIETLNELIAHAYNKLHARVRVHANPNRLEFPVRPGIPGFKIKNTGQKTMNHYWRRGRD